MIVNHEEEHSPTGEVRVVDRAMLVVAPPIDQSRFTDRDPFLPAVINSSEMMSPFSAWYGVSVA